MKYIKQAIAIIETRMYQLVAEEEYERAADLKKRLDEIKRLLGLNPYK